MGSLETLLGTDKLTPGALLLSIQKIRKSIQDTRSNTKNGETDSVLQDKAVQTRLLFKHIVNVL